MSHAPPPDRSSRIRRLTNVSRALTYVSSLDSALALTVDCAIDVLDAERAVLMLHDAEGLLRVRAARGIDDALTERFREPLDETLVYRLESLFGAGARDRFLGVPLVVRGRVTGLLAVDRGRNTELTEEEEWLLSALADQASVALDSAARDERRSQLEDEVAQLAESRANTHRALQIAGHDLRTPLNAMQGYVELLRSGVVGPISERQEELLARVQVVGRHVLSVLENVLDMARLANETQNINIADVALTTAVQDALLIMSPAARQKGVSLAARAGDDVIVRADPDRLRQVLLHLLDNAVKYSAADTAVTVSTDVLQERDRTWGVVRVSDQGPGIPRDRAEDVFQPYRRLYIPSNSDPGGTGLGLSIARGLIELMGGALTLDPVDGPGATFCIRLLLAPDAARAE